MKIRDLEALACGSVVGLDGETYRQYALLIRGDMAVWSDPAQRPHRMTLSYPTLSALQGMMGSWYYKPEGYAVIDFVKVLRIPTTKQWGSTGRRGHVRWDRKRRMFTRRQSTYQQAYSAIVLPEYVVGFHVQVAVSRTNDNGVSDDLRHECTLIDRIVSRDPFRLPYMGISECHIRGDYELVRDPDAYKSELEGMNAPLGYLPVYSTFPTHGNGEQRKYFWAPVQMSGGYIRRPINATYVEVRCPWDAKAPSDQAQKNCANSRKAV